MNEFYSLWDTYIFEHDFLDGVIFSFYENMNLFIAHWFYKHISFSPWRAVKKKKGQQAEVK